MSAAAAAACAPLPGMSVKKEVSERVSVQLKERYRICVCM